MNKRSWLTLTTAAIIAVALPAVAADNLELASVPLFSGTSAKPNILVAVDDSGSMDQEVLFPTDEGVLYWNRSAGAAADGSGNFYNSGNDTYAYVFPFDHIQPNPTIPPTPGMAYGRAPDYNKAYFNPTPDPDGGRIYLPWLKGDGSRGHRPDESPTGARYKPDSNSGTRDLTVAHFDAFDFDKGMVVSADHWRHWRVLFKQCLAERHGLQGCLDRLGPRELQESISNISEQQVAYCVQSDNDLFNCLGQLGLSLDETVNSNETASLLYFPAIFYLKPASERGPGDASLPADYGYKADKTIEGKGPAGEPLVGYEIKPDNFDTTAHYQDAIRDFANWFTYYRKRNLATRGGIVAAFDRISDIRVGSCTINNRSTLKMKDLDEIDQRTQFYSDIFNIDYSQNRGTPNRLALKHLGDQLENNTSIITAPCQRNFAILFTDGYSNSDNVNVGGNIDGGYGDPFKDSYSNTIADIAMKYYTDLNTNVKGILRPPEECAEPNPPKRLDCETDLHMTTFAVTLNQTGTIFNKYDTEAHKKQNSDPYNNPPNWPNVTTGGKSAKQIDDLWHATVNTRGELLDAETPSEVADKFTTALERILGTKGAATSVSLDSSSLSTGSVAYQASFVAGAWTGELLALPLNAPAVSFGDAKWKASERLTEHTNPNDRVILTRARNNCNNGHTKRKTVPLRFDRLKKHCPELSQTQVGFIRGERDQERANTGTLRNRNNNILGDIIHSNPLYVGVPNRLRYPADWNDLLYDGDEPMPEDPPDQNSGENTYRNFASAKDDRKPMVYAGANDGMLHGFDAETGDEKIAYIPGDILGRLAALTNPNYVHQYYVDGSPVSGDVFINNSWRTVLVGGLRAGGRSIYALDITDPSNFSERNTDTVMWEYDNPDLGYTFGKPSIVRLHDGRWAAVFGNGYNSTSGNAELFIVDIKTGELIRKIDTGVGSSGGSDRVACYYDKDSEYKCDDKITICYNDRTYRDDEEHLQKYLGQGARYGSCGDNEPGCYYDKDGQYACGDKTTICYNNRTYRDDIEHLQKYLDKGATYNACDTNKDGDSVNGLGEPFSVDLDGDFITDYIYAGDLQGHMWKFDLTDKSENKWKVGLGGQALFTATDADGTPQPITTQPQVAMHPYGKRFGVMVYFGTGKYIEQDDRYAKDETISSFYGIQDVDVFSFNKANDGGGSYNTTLTSNIPRSRLQQQTITSTKVGNNGSGDDDDDNTTTYRLVSDNTVDYQTDDDSKDPKGKRGWYLDLPKGEGEMVVTNSSIQDNTVAFSTTIPNTETCSASGSGYFMLLDRGTGGRTKNLAFDLNGDTQLNTKNDTFTENGKKIGASGILMSDGIPGQAAYQTDPTTDKSYYIVQDSSGKLHVVYTHKDANRRWSWREIRR